MTYKLDTVLQLNCIVTRRGVDDEISPEPQRNPMGGARGMVWYGKDGMAYGIRWYCIVQDGMVWYKMLWYGI